MNSNTVRAIERETFQKHFSYAFDRLIEVVSDFETARMISEVQLGREVFDASEFGEAVFKPLYDLLQRMQILTINSARVSRWVVALRKAELQINTALANSRIPAMTRDIEGFLADMIVQKQEKARLLAEQHTNEESYALSIGDIVMPEDTRICVDTEQSEVVLAYEVGRELTDRELLENVYVRKRQLKDIEESNEQ